ncbi:TPA: hypothetical protein N2D99_002208 [Clostridium botulinum]|nr:hypothetical protein [Clostridium botulinum]
MKNTLTLGMVGSGKSTLSKFSMLDKIDEDLSVLVIDLYEEFLNIQEITMYSCLLDKFIECNKIAETIKKTRPQLTVVNVNINYNIVDNLQKILDKALKLKIDVVYINRIFAIEFLRNLNTFMPYKNKLSIEVDAQILNDKKININLVHRYFDNLCITKINPNDIDFLVANFNVNKNNLISTLTSSIGQSQLYQI